MEYNNHKLKKHININHSKLNIVMGALLLLILTCFADAPINLLHKKTVHILTKKNTLTNYIITLFIIYFVIDFAYQDTKHPLYEIGISLLILSIYIMYTKVHYTLQISLFFILIIIYFVNDNINYSIQQNHLRLIRIYSILKNILITIGIFILFTGFSLQFM
jgi:hypothetical protein